MEIELCGYKVQIDEEDYDRVTNLCWYVRKDMVLKNGDAYFYHGYCSKTVDGKWKTIRVSLQRFIMNAKYKDGTVVDHINGNVLDNRKCNLRVCTVAENIRNSRMKKTNTTGYKGVTYNKGRNKYIAQICVNRKQMNLGYFDTPEEAHAAYCKASEKYHGEFGRTE